MTFESPQICLLTNLLFAFTLKICHCNYPFPNIHFLLSTKLATNRIDMLIRQRCLRRIIIKIIKITIWRKSLVYNSNQLIMWTIASEPIEKNYNARILSRSFLLSVCCCLFAFVIPILMLVSIGYSWNTYQQKLIQPSLTFQQHQLSCLLNDGNTIYDSTLTNQIATNNYQSFISVGVDGSQLIISGLFAPTNIVACSILLYFQVSLKNFRSVAVLPIQFQSTASTGNLVTINQWGTVTTKLLSAIPGSSIPSQNFLNYYDNSSQILGITDTHHNVNQAKKLTLIPKTLSKQEKYSSTPGSLTYSGIFAISAQTYLQQVSLLTNLRTFVPYFIYLFIIFWVFLTQPTVRWMLQNKIYRSKVAHPKIKNL